MFLKDSIKFSVNVNKEKFSDDLSTPSWFTPDQLNSNKRLGMVMSTLTLLKIVKLSTFSKWIPKTVVILVTATEKSSFWDYSRTKDLGSNYLWSGDISWFSSTELIMYIGHCKYFLMLMCRAVNSGLCAVYGRKMEPRYWWKIALFIFCYCVPTNTIA